MKNKLSKYKYGDKVRVITGVKDPDFGSCIEGWSGEIDEIDNLENGSWIYRITFDKKTLSRLNDDYISKCEDANLDYEHIYLEEKELEPLNSNGEKRTMSDKEIALQLIANRLIREHREKKAK